MAQNNLIDRINFYSPLISAMVETKYGITFFPVAAVYKRAGVSCDGWNITMASNRLSPFGIIVWLTLMLYVDKKKRLRINNAHIKMTNITNMFQSELRCYRPSMAKTLRKKSKFRLFLKICLFMIFYKFILFRKRFFKHTNNKKSEWAVWFHFEKRIDCRLAGMMTASEISIWIPSQGTRRQISVKSLL